MMEYVVAAGLGYLVGSFPTAYLVVKQLTGQDIRTIGSGNVGATNVKRAAGFKPYLFVLLFDMCKGLVPVWFSTQLYPKAYFLHILVALATVIGHSKSIFLKFAGGKSAATGLGGMMGLAPVPALLLGVLAFTITKFTRFVSLGSITASLLAPVMLYLFGCPRPYVGYAAVAGLYVIFLHRANIQRLLKGTENRI
ncbi:MAG: acyl-phosphate glycerol 3-phosphate acyltransferase [Vampirovibrio sp.]|jgi:glycerol-3-phosphate acyltransferase PlsY|nr:acyl-phosphate glycerol 3-phosphate acyltransferase [Vampirovibrio sp.]